MREILFRGKRLDNGELVDGNLFVSDTDRRTYILAGSRIVTIEWEVDPSTVGQYTGLVDKNGRRIFEGDIVKSIETKETGVVQFFPEHSAFMVWCKSSNEVGFLYECTSIAGVIGNIHDNPELLEEA